MWKLHQFMPEYDRPNVEIPMFPFFLQYGIFVEVHWYGNTFPKFSNIEPKKILIIYL